MKWALYYHAPAHHVSCSCVFSVLLVVTGDNWNQNSEKGFKKNFGPTFGQPMVRSWNEQNKDNNVNFCNKVCSCSCTVLIIF